MNGSGGQSLSIPLPGPRDLLLALGVGLLVAVSPFTPVAFLPSLLIGGACGVAPLAWRMWSARTGRNEAAAAPESWIEIPAGVWPALAAVAILSGPTLVWLYDSWTGNVWNNGHGILIPVAMVYMARQTLRRDPVSGEESSPWGWAFLAVAVPLLVVDAALQTHMLAAVGLILALPGVSLLVLGARRTRSLAVPLVLGVFMIPVPNTVATHLYLKQITAMGVEPVLTLVGMPVLREHTILEVPNATFLVADACSGFSALYAAVGMSIVLAASARSWPRKLLLVLSAFPLALACNIARVTILVLSASHFGLGLLDTPFHTASGVVTFWAVLVLLFLMADRQGLRDSYA